jgi:hypothetical protein
MCEQCMPTLTGYRSYRFAIRKCPRLATLGPATVAWLEQAINAEVDAELEIEREGDSHTSALRTTPLARPARLALAVAVVAIFAIGLAGMARAHILWGWWRASPTNIMLASALLAELVIAAALIRLLPRRRPRDAR